MHEDVMRKWTWRMHENVRSEGTCRMHEDVRSEWTWRMHENVWSQWTCRMHEDERNEWYGECIKSKERLDMLNA
jgi:hypothetical protein